MSELVRRTSMFVPINKRDFIEKAWLRGADALILDLEDSIPDPEKDRARRLVKESIPIAARGSADILVRINKPLMEEDLDASVWPGLAAIMLPKAETADDIHALDSTLTRLELARGLAQGSIQIALLVESALGVWNLHEVLSASARIITASAGGLDFMLDLGQEPDRRLDNNVYARQKLLIVARITNVQPQGMAPNPMAPTGRGEGRDGEDSGRFQSAVFSRKAGFRGTNLIHPAGIDQINRGFTPQPEDLEYARRALAVYQEGLERGIGAVSLDGQMVDLPVVLRAEKIIARSGEIAAFEARREAALRAAGVVA